MLKIYFATFGGRVLLARSSDVAFVSQECVSFGIKEDGWLYMGRADELVFALYQRWLCLGET
jgi:hypothetical protein